MLAFFSLAQTVRVAATSYDIEGLSIDREQLESERRELASDLNRLGREPAIRKLAIDAGLSGYAAPLGMIEAGADSFAGAIPTILKLNSANSLSTIKDQALTGSVADALRLGCSAIGCTSRWSWSTVRRSASGCARSHARATRSSSS